MIKYNMSPVVEVAPVARPGYLRVYGRKKSPEEVQLLINMSPAQLSHLK
jgi:hypothetical protein